MTSSEHHQPHFIVSRYVMTLGWNVGFRFDDHDIGRPNIRSTKTNKQKDFTGKKMTGYQERVPTDSWKGKHFHSPWICAVFGINFFVSDFSF